MLHNKNPTKLLHGLKCCCVLLVAAPFHSAGEGKVYLFFQTSRADCPFQEFAEKLFGSICGVRKRGKRKGATEGATSLLREERAGAALHWKSQDQFEEER